MPLAHLLIGKGYVRSNLRAIGIRCVTAQSVAQCYRSCRPPPRMTGGTLFCALILESDSVSVDRCALCNCLADKASVCHAASVACAWQGDRIGVGEEVALDIAYCEKTADGSVFLIKNL